MNWYKEATSLTKDAHPGQGSQTAAREAGGKVRAEKSGHLDRLRLQATLPASHVQSTLLTSSRQHHPHRDSLASSTARGPVLSPRLRLSPVCLQMPQQTLRDAVGPLPLEEGQPTLSVKDQMANIWGSGGPRGSVTTTQLCCGWMKTALEDSDPRGSQTRAICPQGTFGTS